MRRKIETMVLVEETLFGRVDKVQVLSGRAHDHTGEKYGKLTVLRPVYLDGLLRWECECECGKRTYAKGSSLKRRVSCGCEQHKPRTGIENAHYKHGAVGTRLYSIYTGMLKRCRQPSTNGYERYGGRGIRVCEEWKGEHGFEHFRDWANANGYSEDLTLDRIDTNGNYEPENCKWSTREEQCNNRRNNVWLEYNGERHTMAQWAKILGIPVATVNCRKSKGWSDEKVLTYVKPTKRG